MKRNLGRILKPKLPLIERIRDLPQRYQLTKTGIRDESYEKFLLSKPESDDDPQILMFSAEWALRELEKAKCWIMDGTFRITPPMFSQVKMRETL